MAITYYANLQEIREQAGMQQNVKGETPTGTVDGSNKTFTTAYKPIVDSNYSDTVDSTDVVVYDNGNVVATGNYTVTAAAGQIIFGTAPVSGHVITIDYSFSPINDSEVTKIRASFHSLIDGIIGKLYLLPIATPANTPILEQLELELAAAAILRKSYGTTGTNTSQDGYAMEKSALARLEQVRTEQVDLMDDTTGAVLPKRAEAVPGASNVYDPSSGSVNEKGELFTTADETFAVQDPARLGNPSTPTFDQNTFP